MKQTPVGIRISHIPTSENVIVDIFLHFPSESDLLMSFPSLCQTQKELSGCHDFLLNAKLISFIMDALLQGICIGPIALNRRLLMDPGRITSSPGVIA